MCGKRMIAVMNMIQIYRPLAVPTCQAAPASYIKNETGAVTCKDNRALGQSPENKLFGLCPGMEGRIPAGAWLFNQTINNSHNKPRQNAGEDVEQELLHKATSFTEDCPANLIAHGLAQFNRAGRGLFVF